MTKFVIISQQRSGTNLLRSLLNSHPDIFCFGEMFIPSGEVWDKAMDVTEYRFPAYHNYFPTDKEGYICESTYINELYDSKKDFQAVGFDLKYNQIDFEMRSRITPKEIKIIHLVRENILDTVLSEIWHEAVDNKDKFPIYVSMKKIEKDIEYIKANINSWDDLIDYKTSYKMIQNMINKKNNRLCDFLDIKSYKLTTTLKKNKHDYSKLIKNYEKIQHVFGKILSPTSRP